MHALLSYMLLFCKRVLMFLVIMKDLDELWVSLILGTMWVVTFTMASIGRLDSGHLLNLKGR
jgi:hypothetical protein